MVPKLIAVIGASGYVGSRLVPRLVKEGYRVRAIARSQSHLQVRPWSAHSAIEMQRADVLDREALARTCVGCDAAYYLVHSMHYSNKRFAEIDATAARNMARAAEDAGLKRIIYLGGLGDEHAQLSRHLRSRAEVARILQSGKVPVTVLRAAMIIGKGSASYEILRYLAERLPVMITPRWVHTECQPIAIENALNYLVRCLDTPETAGDIFDIGGPEIVTYRDLFDLYAELICLPKRLIVPVPVLTPRLSSYWIHFVTPVPGSLARPLAEGLRNRVVCKDHRIRDLIPQQLLSCREAIQHTLEETDSDLDSNMMLSHPERAFPGDPQWAYGTVFTTHRQIDLKVTAEEMWNVFRSIGGKNNWYFARWLWKLRAFMDVCMGGIGMRSGRSNRSGIAERDTIDFWRVTAVEALKHLVMVAEMKLPGKAVLKFRIVSEDESSIELHQTEEFHPKGLGGIVYYYIVYPLHQLLFQGMLRTIAGRAKRASDARHDVKPGTQGAKNDSGHTN